MKLRLITWTLLVTLFVSTLLVVSKVFGEEYKTISHEYNLTYEQYLREKISRIPLKAPVKLDLKSGETVVGTFLKYSKYDDSIWIKPEHPKYGIFSNEAYDVRDLFDINIVVKKPV